MKIIENKETTICLPVLQLWLDRMIPQLQLLLATQITWSLLFHSHSHSVVFASPIFLMLLALYAWHHELLSSQQTFK